MGLGGTLFLVMLIILSVPVIVFSVQVICSLLPYNRKLNHDIARSEAEKTNLPSIAVLIPAHNEQQGIVATLSSIKAQITTNDRILVIADNCDDKTAEVARTHGALVIERSNMILRGKSYALDFGVRYLEANTPPQVVIIVDADCIAKPGSIALLAQQAIIKDRPVQALYLMQSPLTSSLKSKVAEFAWAVKNWSRALGFHYLGLPCQLMGSGMAFPWIQIKQANLASGHIVEDLKLGLDFASNQKAPYFCADAIFTSMFPANPEGVKSQRSRWEHGHLAMIIKDGPRLIFSSVRSLNMPMLALALDMCVPPLALLTTLVFTLTIISMIAIFTTDMMLPWIGAAYLLMLLIFVVLLAWVKFGRKIISFSDLLYIPVYMLAKIPLYIGFFIKRQVEWVKTKRD